MALKTYKVNYVLLNDETEYACTIYDAINADDAEIRFLGDCTEDERRDLTVTSIEEVR